VHGHAWSCRVKARCSVFRPRRRAVHAQAVRRQVHGRDLRRVPPFVAATSCRRPRSAAATYAARR
jgi:hypothetical protein